MTTADDPRKRLAAVMGALAEDVQSTTDEELLADAAAAGIDAEVESNRVRGLLLSGVLRANKTRVAAASQERDKSVGVLARRGPRPPTGPSERRAFLLQSLEQRPQLKGFLGTFGQRDVATASDTDVESLLKELAAQGLLKPEDPDGEP